MPETATKHTLLAAIKPEGSTTIELAIATGIERVHAVKLLTQMREDGLVAEPVKKLTTYLWRRKQPALPQTECENGYLINS